MNAEHLQINRTLSISKPSKCERRPLKNLIVISLGFLLQFCTFNGLEVLQSTLNAEGSLGIISEFSGYACVIISALFLPKLIIRRFGCKITLVVCTLASVPWVAANFRPSLGSIVPTSILYGLSTGPMWSSQSTYINQVSSIYANQKSESVEVATSRFFGIFFMIYQTSRVWGSLISFFVLKPSHFSGFDNRTIRDDCSQNGTSCPAEQVACGARFCSDVNENMAPPSDEKRFMLVGIYLGLVVLAAAVFGFLLDPLKKEDDEDESLLSRAVATLKHLTKTDQMLLVPLTMFSGIFQAFILADFSKAYAACQWGVHYIGVMSIFLGVVDSVMSYFSGCLVKYISRITLMYIGAALNAATCIVLLLWEPTSKQHFILYIVASAFGVQDAILQTQLNAFYGVIFRSEEEAAFANYSLWESLGFTVSFGYTSFLCTVPKISLLMGFSFAGMLGYTIAEVRHRRRNQHDKMAKQIHLRFKFEAT